MSTSTTPKRGQLAIRFHWDDSHWYSAKSVALQGTIVEDVPDRGRLPVYDHELSGLRIEARLSQWDAAGTDRHVSYDTEYRDLWSVDLARAKQIARVLGKLQAALERAEREDGSVANFGQYVARVAKVLGIRSVVIEADLSRMGERELPAGTGGDCLNYIIDYWRREGVQPFESRAA